MYVLSKWILPIVFRIQYRSYTNSNLGLYFITKFIRISVTQTYVFSFTPSKIFTSVFQYLCAYVVCARARTRASVVVLGGRQCRGGIHYWYASKLHITPAFLYLFELMNVEMFITANVCNRCTCRLTPSSAYWLHREI